MKKYLLYFGTLLCLIPLVFALNSCGKNDETLYFLNFKPESAPIYSELAAKYKEETGVTLRVVTAASGSYEQTLKSEIGKKDAPVLFQINGPLGYASWKDYCKDLKDTEIYSHLTDKNLAIKGSDGGVYGIPYVVEGYGIIYNSAITDRYFALPNKGTSYTSMNDIKSFSALKALAEDMTAHKSELGIRGVFAATSLKSGEDWRWQTHLANLPIYEELTRGNADISQGVDEVNFTYNPQFKQIFDLYINNSTTDPKLLGSKQVADSMAEFALGQCAMVQNGNWAWSQISQVQGNTVQAENIHFLPIYMGLEDESTQGLCIGTENFFAINSKVSEEKQKMAEDFLNWMFTSETGKDYVLNRLDFIPPFDTFGADERPSDPLSREVAEYSTREGVHNIPWIFTVFPGQNFKNDFGAALLQYCQGTMSWDGVVNTFKTRWKEEA